MHKVVWGKVRPIREEVESGGMERKQHVLRGTSRVRDNVGMAVNQANLIFERHRLWVGNAKPVVTECVLQLAFADDQPLAAREKAPAKVNRLCGWLRVADDSLRHLAVGTGHCLVHAHRVVVGDGSRLEERLRHDETPQSRWFIQDEDALLRYTKGFQDAKRPSWWPPARSTRVVEDDPDRRAYLGQKPDTRQRLHEEVPVVAKKPAKVH